MKKYIIRLFDPFTEEMRNELQEQGIGVVFHDAILPDLIIVESGQSLAKLRANALFKKVSKERIGTVYV